MIKKMTLSLYSFDSLDDYERLEKRAKDKAFDYSIGFSVQHFPLQHKVIWELVGDQNNIDEFVCYLDI